MSDDYTPAKLVGAENWNSWKFNMRMYLLGKDLFDIVNGTEVLGEQATAKERDIFKKRENRALSIISLGIVTDLQIYVRQASCASEAWKCLFDRFEEKTVAKICYYRKILYRMELGKGQTMEAYINQMKAYEHL